MTFIWVSVAVALHWSQQVPQLTDAAIDETVRGLSAIVAAEYFDVAVTDRITATLEQNRVAGRFASATNARELAERLNTVLYSVTRDKHLRVQAIDPQPAKESATATTNRRDQPTTAGFTRVEVLPNNLGLLEMTMFLRPIEHREALAAAMKQLERCDAVIVDMRANGGGSPATVALLMSYFFDEPELPLFEIVPRTGTPDSYGTEPASAGLIRDGRRPLFILTSTRTFSAGEGFAYLMQERKRGVIVGERTAGAANPGSGYPVNDRFQVTIPNGRVSSAIRRSNWEGTGVDPDIAVPAVQALDAAIQRATAVLKARP